MLKKGFLGVVFLGIGIGLLCNGAESLKLVQSSNSYYLLTSTQLSALERWVTGNTKFISVEKFSSLKEALHSKGMSLGRLPSSRTSSPKASAHLTHDSKTQDVKLSWDRGNNLKPVRMTFKTEEEALFFKHHIDRGHYSRSLYGHSIRLVQ